MHLCIVLVLLPEAMIRVCLEILGYPTGLTVFDGSQFVIPPTSSASLGSKEKIGAIGR